MLGVAVVTRGACRLDPTAGGQLDRDQERSAALDHFGDARPIGEGRDRQEGHGRIEGFGRNVGIRSPASVTRLRALNQVEATPALSCHGGVSHALESDQYPRGIENVFGLGVEKPAFGQSDRRREPVWGGRA